jgi:hypothetical protein
VERGLAREAARVATLEGSRFGALCYDPANPGSMM